MTKKKEIFIYIVEKQITRLVNKWNQLEKKPRDYGSKDLLYPAEIHTIQAVAEFPDNHMSDIAKHLGVTRGAIMQIVLKLEDKKLVKRFMKKNDQKRVYLKLTKRGQKAFDGHKRYHTEMYENLYSMLKDVKIDQLRFLQQIFDTVDSYIETYLANKN